MPQHFLKARSLFEARSTLEARSIFKADSIFTVCLLVSPATGRISGPGGDRTFTQVAKIHASDFQTDDEFGEAVAISGDTAVVGAQHEDAGALSGTEEGAAYVYRRDAGGPGNWGEVAKLTAPDRQSAAFFGNATAISGDTALVTAYQEDTGAGDSLTNSGAVYVFGRDEGGPDGWGLVDELVSLDLQAGDRFGESVAISGDLAVVGATSEDGGMGDPTNNAGAVYVFEFAQGSGWSQATKLTLSDPEAGDSVGRAVAISGDTVIVGVDEKDGDVARSGAAYIYQFVPASGWLEADKLTASDAQMDDGFGDAVAISGGTAIVGARFEDGPGDALPSAGAAYIFEFVQGFGWLETRKLTASDAQEADGFGLSVGIADDIAVVGAPGEDGGPGDPISSAGAVYVFARDAGGPGNWGQIAKLGALDRATNDVLGDSVAISGITAIAGAPGKDGGPGTARQRAGAAYLFRESFLRFFLGDASSPDLGRAGSRSSMTVAHRASPACAWDSIRCRSRSGG